MKGDKKILQITISKREVPKSKFGKWLYWKIWFKVWGIWRPRFLAWFFGGLSSCLYWIAPQSVKKDWDKEFEEIVIQIIKEGKEDLEDKTPDDSLHDNKFDQ